MDDLTSKLNNCDTCDCIQNGLSAAVTEGTGSGYGDGNSELEKNEYSGNEDVNEQEYLNDSFEDDDDLSDYEPSPSEIQRVARSCTEIRYIPNKTFSSGALWEIERNNKILMQKIVSNTKRKNQYFTAPKCTPVNMVSSAAINRKKYNEKIARDNQILLRKIQNVKPCLHHK
nr:unnamed protein product [Callosobruchus analis]